MPLAFVAFSTIALGASSSLSLATPAAFASRAGEPLFCPLAAASFSSMQAPFTFEVRTGAALSAQPPWTRSAFDAIPWTCSALGTLWQHYLHNVVPRQRIRIHKCERSTRRHLCVPAADPWTAAAASWTWGADPSRPLDPRFHVNRPVFLRLRFPVTVCVCDWQEPLDKKNPDVFLDESHSAQGGLSPSGPSASGLSASGPLASMPSDTELKQPSANGEPITVNTNAEFDLSDVNSTASRSRPRHSQTAYHSEERQTSRGQSPRSAASTTSATAPGLQAAWSNALGPATPSTSGTAALKAENPRDASAASPSRAVHASVAVSLRASLPERMCASSRAMSFFRIYSKAANFSAARTPYYRVPPHPKAVKYKFLPATLKVTVNRLNSLDVSPSTSAPSTATCCWRLSCCNRWERPA